MAEIKMASGLTEGAQLGASVSVKERNKIADLVTASIAQGAEVKLGGKLLLATALSIHQQF